jgi:alkylation response protein AidB-like acyl-CoA dehydrogenase
MKAQDTSELFFQDVRVPKENLLGQAGMGFAYLMQELPQERLTVAIGGLASAEAALQWTLDYTRERKAFGKAIADFQNTRFKLAEMATEIQIGRVLSIAAWSCICKASSTCQLLRWPSTGAPTCNARCSTSACSCMAATASCGNTRSPGRGRMRGCSGSMPAPTKS